MVRAGGPGGASKKRVLSLSGGVCNGPRAWQIGAVRASFLIPAYNEEKFVGRAVDSVHRAAAACVLTAYEVVVCDNDSTDGTARVARTAGARGVAWVSSGRRAVWVLAGLLTLAFALLEAAFLRSDCSVWAWRRLLLPDSASEECKRNSIPTLFCKNGD